MMPALNWLWTAFLAVPVVVAVFGLALIVTGIVIVCKYRHKD